ncbi:MAG: right-handed parallel beta-helix repeat-containing protein [Candidatus Thiodiazotropha taylori]|uniref:Right-handed parallel beta-helix repeat-containing protein n=1 Tax=Candidatus Thiodiazotropha taylori TaxID=2792791 RepID=A0A9E4N5V7_9GAMM|nr:right-handed parallel beta-helix repeat-containing protein [Candidatus Thiodiazotropha taylori]MCW4258161.1 right-handed parallel beta-helix repeat-containing protein [Candidatus Thiodiazotropha taylori]
MLISLKRNQYDGIMRFSDPEGTYLSGGGNPSYTPTHWIDPTASGGGDGSALSPWTWAEFLTNLSSAYAATPGDMKVMVLPGELQATTTDERFIPAFQLPIGGAVAKRIIVFAQNRAIDTATTALRTKLTTTATTQAVNGCPVIGSQFRDYITWDGFWIDEVDALPTADTGPVILNQCQGVHILGCLLEGMDLTGYDNWGASPAENHNGIRIEGMQDCVIADNKISGFVNPSGSHNGAGIMSYTSINLENNSNNVIENNEIDSCGCGIYIKGQWANTNSGSFTIRKNYIHSNQNAGIEFGGHTGSASYVHQNLCVANNHGIMLGRDEVNNVKVYNNTIANSTDTSLFLKANISSYSGNEFGNNISINPANAHVSGDVGPVTGDIIPDYNCYDLNSSTWYINSTSYSSFATYDSGSGVYEDNSVNADPVIVGGGDYSLDTGSPCIDAGIDTLNILGGGTSAPINMGAYVNSDTIGLRLAA